MEEIIKDPKCLEGYPENIQKALKIFMQYSDRDKYGKHIVKTYNVGCIGIASELNSEMIINNNPICRIFEKYYPNLGSFTIGINNITNRIFPCYTKDGKFHSFTEDMIANKEMWDEMAECKLVESTYEYEEDIPVNLQYLTYYQNKIIEENKKRKKWYQFWKC